MTDRRIDTYDNARAILILLVVLGHVLNYANPGYVIKPYIIGQQFIWAFHMPAFFLLSGVLMHTDKWRKSSWGDFLFSRMKSLLVPYVFFEVAAILYKHFVLHTITVSEGLQNMICFRCNVGADWFLPAMFLAQIGFFLYVKYPNRIIAGLLALACFCCDYYLPEGGLWNVLWRGMMGFAFTYLGHLLKKSLNVTPSSGVKPVAIWLGAFLATGLCAALNLKYFGSDFYDCVCKSPLIFVVGGLCGTYVVLGISKLIHWRPFAWLGQNSLIVMGTHQLVLYTIPGSASPLWVLGVFVVIIALEVPVILFCDRFCPGLVGKRESRQSAGG